MTAGWWWGWCDGCGCGVGGCLWWSARLRRGVVLVSGLCLWVVEGVLGGVGGVRPLRGRRCVLAVCLARGVSLRVVLGW